MSMRRQQDDLMTVITDRCHQSDALCRSVWFRNRGIELSRTSKADIPARRCALRSEATSPAFYPGSYCRAVC